MTAEGFDHRASLSFSYPDQRRARAVADAVSVERGEISKVAQPDAAAETRSATSVERAGATLTVAVRADDLVALRAGLNTWRRLVGVAERVAADAE